MKILYDDGEITLAEFPACKRGILFEKLDKPCFLYIPEYYAIYNHQVDRGLIISKNGCFLDFGNSELCGKGRVFSNINKFVDWYWNSYFLRFQNHTLFNINNLNSYWKKQLEKINFVTLLSGNHTYQ